MKTYTTLFLDLDNTLLDFNEAERFAVTKVLKKYGFPHTESDVRLYSAINRSYWERFERGEIPKEAIYEGRFKTFFEHYSISTDIKKISDEYCSTLAFGYFKIDGSDEILTYLKAKGYRLCATTNGLCSTQYRRIEHSGLGKYFDKVFVSEEAHHQKPEKEYFDFVIDNIPEKERGNILIIGDSQSSDILGGINSGIDTCWYNPERLVPKYYSKYEIHSLEELKQIL